MKESLLTLQELTNAVQGKLIGDKNNFSELYFDSVTTDSRQVKKDSLFVPLIGEFQDGHKYIPQAIEKGASVVFVTDSVYKNEEEKYISLAEKNPNVHFVCVENNLYALQNAARRYVEKFPNLLKIAITGSSGKTTTKEIMASILRQQYNLVATEGNFNSETGLPLSVFNIRKEHTAGLFEMGMNRVNEIGEIASVFKPENAIITNIGTAHIGILGSRENIAIEKKKIFNYIDENGFAVIYNKDDFADFLSKDVKGKVIFFGEEIPESQSGVKFIEDLGVAGTKFAIDGIEVTLKIPGKYNYLNALSCIAMAKALGISSQKIVNGIKELKAIDGRSNIKTFVTKKDSLGKSKKITILEDCYNANPDSMESALKMCAGLKIKGRKIFILGDMFELGEESTRSHINAGKIAIEAKPDLLVLIGNEMENAFSIAKNSTLENVHFYNELTEENLNELSNKLLEYICDDDFVFVKASHGMHLEKIISKITEPIEEKKE